MAGLSVPELSGSAQDVLEKLVELAARQDPDAGDVFEALEAAREDLGGEWPVVALALGACPEHGCDLDVCRDDKCLTVGELMPCARCGYRAAVLSPVGELCPGCVTEACAVGAGGRAGLPVVPHDRVPAALAALGRVLLLGMHGQTDEGVLVRALTQRSCIACGATPTDGFRPGDGHVVVAGALAVGCEGFHTAALRAAALLEVIVMVVDPA